MSEQNSLCFPCLEKVRTKFPAFLVPWQPCSTHVCVCVCVLGGWGPQVNKFEQVSSLGHQMSPAGGPEQWGPSWTSLNMSDGEAGPGQWGGVSHVKFHVLGRGWGWGPTSGGRAGARAGGGSLYGEVHCIVGNGHIGRPPEQTDKRDWKD